MPSNDFFSYNPQYATWATEFPNGLAFVSCSTQINYNISAEEMKTNKPVYLAVMANRQQLQPIIDNPHLFDPAFVNAAHLVIRQYEDLKIEG